MKRQWRTNKQKKILMDRIEHLIRVRKVTATEACRMVGLASSVYTSWRAGRGYNPDGDPNQKKNYVTPTYRRPGDPAPKTRAKQRGRKVTEFDFVNGSWQRVADLELTKDELPKAAKVQPAIEEPISFTLTYNGDEVTLSCKKRQFARVVNMLIEQP